MTVFARCMTPSLHWRPGSAPVVHRPTKPRGRYVVTMHRIEPAGAAKNYG